ncbi:hypothetical protein DL98DRAFT_189323 [Cadophora sp. DSE1049]|nr:hypothetical protein DL98DRAFT_189323 [Cadophora sp. DSE1049]
MPLERGIVCEPNARIFEKSNGRKRHDEFPNIDSTPRFSPHHVTLHSHQQSSPNPSTQLPQRATTTQQYMRPKNTDGSRSYFEKPTHLLSKSVLYFV